MIPISRVVSIVLSEILYTFFKLYFMASLLLAAMNVTTTNAAGQKLPRPNLTAEFRR
jgi:hypothetical protein